jgi:hypothetical protein
MIIPSASFSESRFWKHIGLILIIKIIAITLLWWLFFSPRYQVKPDDALMQHQLTESSHYDRSGR